MKKILLLGMLAVVFGLSFTVFTLLVRANVFDRLDFDVMVKIHDRVPVRLDPLLQPLTFLASFPVMVAILVGILVIARKWVLVLVDLGLFFFAHVTELIGKQFLHHPPPPFYFYRHETHAQYDPWYAASHSSYPSGHSMRMMFVSIVLLWLIWQVRPARPSMAGEPAGGPGRLAWLKFILSAIVLGVVGATLVSRVSLGEHWPTDVVGGVLLGVTFAVVGVVFSGERR